MNQGSSEFRTGSGLTRRHLLRLTGMGLASSTALALLAACAPPSVAPTAAPPTAPPAAKAAPTPAPAKAKSLEKATYTLNYILYGGHAPYYLARERGYFAEQGLDVEILEGKGSAATAKLVGAGSSPLGEVDASVVLSAVAEDVPIKVVAGLVQKSPLSVIVLKASGIKSPKDLEGKKVGGTPASVVTVFFETWLKLNGVNPDKVQVVSMGPEVLDTSLVQRQVDGILGFDEHAVKINAAGGDSIAIHYADYGLNLPSTAITANTAFMKEKPAVVRGFVAGALRGWADAQKDPKAAVAAMMKYAPPVLKADPETDILANLVTLLHSKQTEGKPIGWMAREDWEQAIDLLSTKGDLRKKLRVEDVMTNEFVPAS